jgi:hypothetical protein
MSASVSSGAAFGETADQVGGEDGMPLRQRGTRRGRRRMVMVGGAVVVLAAVGGASAWAAGAFGSGNRAASGVTDNAYPTSLASVTRESLSSQQLVSATLGYAGSYTVLNQAQGLYTQLPSAGQVVRRGKVLYEVSGAPVVLLYGKIPAYRSLSEGMTGADVRQLNANLVALRYATKSELDPTSDYFSWETAYALELYQDHLGITETGTLDLGQAVFLPAAARITTISATLGGQAAPSSPALAATSTSRQVSIALDAADQSDVRVGDHVSITLPNNQVTRGVVSYVGTVATAPPSTSGGTSTPVITVNVALSDPSATGSVDQAPVQVSITTDAVSGVLVVPVNALVSLAGGGYAVEVVKPGGARELVPVTLGLFDDALGDVQVSGTGLQAGQRVVVPAL